MKVVLVVPFERRDRLANVPVGDVRRLLARDRIDSVVAYRIDPDGANSIANRPVRVARRNLLKLRRAAVDRRMARTLGALGRGDTVVLLGVGDLGDSTFAHELVRRDGVRVVSVLGSAAEAAAALSDPFYAQHADVVLVPDRPEGRVPVVRVVPEIASGPVASWYDSLRRAIFRPVRIYGLFYRFADLFEETVAALKEHTDVDYRLFVAENASAESERNREVVLPYLERGDVEGYVLFKENVYGSAFEHLYRRFFPPDDDDEIVVFSDMDMTIPPTASDWLRRMLTTFARFPEVAALSLDFDLGNWNRDVAKGHLPPDERLLSAKYGIYRMPSGIWFLAIRNRIIGEYLDGARVFADREIFRYISTKFMRRVFGRLPVRCRHLSWDLETAAPDYVATKYESFYTKVYERHECPEAEVYLRPEPGYVAAR